MPDGLTMNGSSQQRRAWLLPAAIALIAGAIVIASRDPVGKPGGGFDGPGLTCDEWFNVLNGAILDEKLGIRGIGLLDPRSLMEAFSDEYTLQDHPPLGRLLIGFAHRLGRGHLADESGEVAIDTAAARRAPATAFAVTVFLAGLCAARWFGNVAGVAAAGGLALMPRVFGHAHIASLESFIGLAVAACVFHVADRWKPGAPPSHRTAAISGVLFGLAMLTKIQAVLFPLPIALWALWHYRRKAIIPLALFGAVGAVVFFVGWPWLWSDPVNHLREYFARTTDRYTLYVWYFGDRVADHDVAWHYPFVFFLVTVPVGLHALGLLGLLAKRTSPEERSRIALLASCTVFPLVVFAIPGITVYDGARLFLVVFPLWAVLVGRGAALAWDSLCRWMSPRMAAVALGSFLALQAYGLWSMAPCHLSYYNLLVGGSRGAELLGLEVTYWGDSLTPGLWRTAEETLPDGATIAISPVIHGNQLVDIERQSPIVARKKFELVPYEPGLSSARYVMLYRRLADLPPELRTLPPNAKVLASVRRQGVALALLLEFE